MSKVGIEVTIDFEQLTSFLNDIQLLEKKYGIQAKVDEKKNIVSFNVLDVLQVETKSI